MSRKQIVLVVIVVLVASGLSALVAYRRGLRRAASWGSAGSETVGCVDFRGAGAHTGTVGCVSGRLLRVFTSRAGNTFLDFCPDYRSCPFTSVIFSSDRNKFRDLETLTGRQVEIRGAITAYQGRAEIIVRDPQQIRLRP